MVRDINFFQLYEALIWAAINGHTETVKLLLDRGADIHAWNDTRFVMQQTMDIPRQLNYC